MSIKKPSLRGKGGKLVNYWGDPRGTHPQEAFLFLVFVGKTGTKGVKKKS